MYNLSFLVFLVDSFVLECVLIQLGVSGASVRLL